MMQRKILLILLVCCANVLWSQASSLEELSSILINALEKNDSISIKNNYLPKHKFLNYFKTSTEEFNKGNLNINVGIDRISDVEINKKLKYFEQNYDRLHKQTFILHFDLVAFTFKMAQIKCTDPTLAILKKNKSKEIKTYTMSIRDTKAFKEFKIVFEAMEYSPDEFYFCGYAMSFNKNDKL